MFTNISLMIKYAQIVFLVSSDRDLNDALFDQFQLVDSFKFHIFNKKESVKYLIDI